MRTGTQPALKLRRDAIAYTAHLYPMFCFTYFLTKIEFKTGYGYPGNCNRVTEVPETETNSGENAPCGSRGCK